MQDRYLYKAKRQDNGEWVEGNIVLSNDADDDFEAIIIPRTDSNMFTKHVGFKEVSCDLGFENWHKVCIDTLCQCTGLTDRNGTLIWENDLVSFLDVSQYDNGYSEHWCIGKVVWDEETLSFQVTERISCESYEVLNGDCAVIGNKFDNPELLEELEE